MATIVGFAMTTLSACGEATPGSRCGCLREELKQSSEIVAATINSDLELTATLEIYRRLQTLAPLAVAQEWSNVVQAIETANTVVPGDPAASNVLLPPATKAKLRTTIREWAMASCDVDLGPVTTLVPRAPEPATPVGAAD